MELNINPRHLFKCLFGAKVMFDYSVKQNDLEEIKYWAESIRFWRSQIKKLNATG